MANNDPFAQLDSQLSQGSNIEQKAVATSPTDNDPWGALDQQLSGSTQNNAPTSATPTNPNDSGGFMAGVENFNRVFGNIAEGTIDLVARATGAKGLQERVANVHDSLQASADQAAQQHPIAAGIGTAAGIVGSAALPLGSAAKGAGLLEQAIVGGGSGALTGFLNYAPSMQDRMNNGAVGAILGAALPVAIQGYKASANTLGGMLKDSEGMTGMIRKVITPKSAATNDVNVINNTKQQVQGVLDDFVPGGKDAVTAKQAELYKGLESVDLPDDIAVQLKTNPVVNDYLEQMKSSPYSTKKTLSDGNFAKLDQIKQNIDNDLYKDAFTTNTANVQKALDPETRNALMQTRNQIVDTLTQAGDTAGIDYAGLRKIGEMKSLYTKLSDTLKQASNQKNLAPNFDPNNLVQNKSIGKLYDVLAGTDLKKEYLINAVESAGGNVDNTKKVITLLNTLRNNSVDALIQNAGKSIDLAKNGLFMGSDKILGAVVNKLITGRYNNAVLKLVSSGPALQEQLTKALNGGTIGKVLTTLGPILNRLQDNAGKIVGASTTTNNSQDRKGYLPQ
jgi:hypothetical protein